MRICVATMIGPDVDPQEAWDTALPLGVEIVATAPGVITDFAKARNDLLAEATKEGYDWAIMLDTDERIRTIYDTPEDNYQGLRIMLSFDGSSGTDLYMVPHVSGTYEKERIFRLPPKGHYHGRTHEAFILDAGAKRESATWMSFDEIPKRPESYRLKCERDRPLLEAMTKEDPEDPRWWYYLGDTYDGLGESDKAINAFVRCWSLNGWDEESAWASFRIATIYSNQGQHQAALERCLKGMLRRADFPEFPWLAGFSCYKLGRYEQALHWSWIAELLGSVDQHRTHAHDVSPRIGFRHPPAHYEGPYDVERWTYKAMGNAMGAQMAEEEFTKALETRTKSATPT